jgi:hypothetical protein
MVSIHINDSTYLLTIIHVLALAHENWKQLMLPI